MERCAAVRLPDPDRTAQLRRRYLAVLLAGLAADPSAGPPGPLPRPDELNWRWRRSTAPDTAQNAPTP